MTAEPTTTETPPTSPDQLLARFGALGIDAQIHHHDPVFTVEEAKALRGLLPGGHCKSLFLRNKKGDCWLVVAEEDRQIDLKRLGALLGAGRLSFGSAERLWRRLGVIPGAVTPFALINDPEQTVTVVLDQAMLRHPRLNYHPLVNDQTATIDRDDLLTFIEACGHRPHILDLDGDG